MTSGSVQETAREQMLKLMAEFDKVSDRAVAVLAGAYLDQFLKEIILATAKTSPENLEILLFSNLSTFNSKIEALRSKKLQIISQEQKEDLHIIRRIRNKFAHEFEDLEFSEIEIAELCSKLHGAKMGGDYPNKPREQFIKSGARLMVDLFIQLQSI